MATVGVIIKVTPGSPDADFDKISEECSKLIKAFAETERVDIKIEPLAFGLKEIKLLFLMEEEKGDLEPLEDQMKKIEGVQNAETIDVRRTIG
jgi:translation elongation factor aEF-1 beta